MFDEMGGGWMTGGVEGGDETGKTTTSGRRSCELISIWLTLI